jgi:probable F420-dependent oxidoreductase
VKLGLGLPVSGPWATPANLRHVAVQAEELGYDSLWAFQRLLHPVDDDWGPMYHSVLDPVSVLAYVAGLTSRIRLGLAVVNAPFYAPIVLSKALTTVDIVSDGRLDVGLGLGWSDLEFEAAGVSRERRGARVEEFVACLRALWTESEVEFHGEFYTVPRSRVDPKPRQAPGPPILMGGAVEAALRRVGRIGDGWISSSREDLTTIASAIGVVREAAVAAGRDPDELRVVVRGVIQLLDEAPAAGTDVRTPLHGDADQIRADLDQLAAQGVTEVFLDLNWDPETSADPDPERALRRAQQVMETFAPH